MKTVMDSFQAVADPGGREILILPARDKPLINARAGNFDMSCPAVSKHIKVFYESGLIFDQRSGPRTV
jgi:DNA-binding transcriptional ArsR family regulator